VFQYGIKVHSFSCQPWQIVHQRVVLITANYEPSSYNTVNMNFAFTINLCVQRLFGLYNYIYLLTAFVYFCLLFLLTSMYIWSLECVELSICSPSMLSWHVQGQFQLYITFTFTSACTFTFLYSHSGMRGMCENLRTYWYFITVRLYALSN
jgi:hypothetical protein